MSNFKKFRLVDEDEFNRSKLKEIRDYNPDLMRRVREETLIEKILNNSELDPGEKIRLITGTITKQKSADLIVSPQQAAAVPAALEEDAEEEEGDDVPEVYVPGANLRKALVHLPGQARIKARRLVEFLQEHPDEVDVTNQNQLMIRGESIAGSNMTDLLNHFYNPRRGIPPKGLQNFMSTLKAIHTPSTLISNRKLAKELSQTGQGKIVAYAKFPKLRISKFPKLHYANPPGLYKTNF